ncbi:MAG: hypothetical protein ABI690_13610 [Chloroflexota bacterium]
MKTAAALRDDLFREKERFDRAVFDHGFNPEERLSKWQAFLVKVQPLGCELVDAEKHETRLRRKDRPTRFADLGTAAIL